MQWPRLLPQYPLAYPHGAQVPQAVQVLKTEEKGSDVNLGVYLVRDCFTRDFSEAAIISNDSDLAEAVRIVTQEGQCAVKVVNPHRHNRISRELCAVSSSHMANINPSVRVRVSFPPPSSTPSHVLQASNLVEPKAARESGNRTS